MNMQVFWREQLQKQRKWIEDHGGDMAGYIANYHERHNRTVENAIDIYKADVAELERISRRVLQ